jgi:hypothetical protein
MSYLINPRKIKLNGPAFEGRGFRTLGWAMAAPKKGKERNELMEKCGRSCFLRPEVKKYPICAALREGKACEVDCRGVLSAKIRARQYKDEVVAKKASNICKLN